jgi:hypothetical protein
LKATAPPRTAVGYLEQIANGEHSSVIGFLFTTHSYCQKRYEQILNFVSNGAMNMLAQNVVFSVGNDAINAPQKCQPRNECSAMLATA